MPSAYKTLTQKVKRLENEMVALKTEVDLLRALVAKPTVVVMPAPAPPVNPFPMPYLSDPPPGWPVTTTSGQRSQQNQCTVCGSDKHYTDVIGDLIFRGDIK